jgi:pimeloyl-ACP methyl ester carboxylesterase
MLRRWLRNLLLLLLFIATILPYLIPLRGGRGVDPTTLTTSGEFVTVGDYRTYVERQGVGNQPAVILLHGFGESTQSWRDTLPALAAAGYDAIALDLKGFGLADKYWSEDYSHMAQADLVAGVMGAFGIERATIVGHSMGGSVAAHFYVRHPEKTEKLIFVDGGAFQLEGEGDSSGLANLLYFPPFRRWARHGLRQFATPENRLRQWRSAYADRSFLTEDRLALRLRYQQTRDWDAAYLGLLRDGNKNGLPRWVTSADIPMTVIWGEQDRWIRLGTGRWFAGRLNAPLVTIPNVGHLPMEEQPLAFNQTLLAALAASNQVGR